jgi:hypothetical protein
MIDLIVPLHNPEKKRRDKEIGGGRVKRFYLLFCVLINPKNRAISEENDETESSEKPTGECVAYTLRLCQRFSLDSLSS